MMMNAGPNILDTRGRLLPRSYDVLGNCFVTSFIVASAFHRQVLILCCCFLFAGLYTTFIFQKPDPDAVPPIATPLLQDSSYDHDEASISDINLEEKDASSYFSKGPEFSMLFHYKISSAIVGSGNCSTSSQRKIPIFPFDQFVNRIRDHGHAFMLWHQLSSCKMSVAPSLQFSSKYLFLTHIHPKEKGMKARSSKYMEKLVEKMNIPVSYIYPDLTLVPQFIRFIWLYIYRIWFHCCRANGRGLGGEKMRRMDRDKQSNHLPLDPLHLMDQAR